MKGFELIPVTYSQRKYFQKRKVKVWRRCVTVTKKRNDHSFFFIITWGRNIGKQLFTYTPNKKGVLGRQRSDMPSIKAKPAGIWYVCAVRLLGGGKNCWENPQPFIALVSWVYKKFYFSHGKRDAREENTESMSVLGWDILTILSVLWSQPSSSSQRLRATGELLHSLLAAERQCHIETGVLTWSDRPAGPTEGPGGASFFLLLSILQASWLNILTTWWLRISIYVNDSLDFIPTCVAWGEIHF